MLKRPSSSSSQAPIRPRQPISNRAGGSSRILGLDHRDQPVAGERVANHRPVARLEDMQRKLGAREEQCAREREDRDAKQRGFHQPNRIAESRAALRTRPGIFEPDRLENLQQPLARRALVPVAVAPDAFEQLRGGAVAVAARHQRAGEVEPRLVIVGIARDPGLELGAVGGGRGVGQRQRRAGAGDRRVVLGLFGQVLELRARLVGAAGGEQGAGEARNRLGILGRHLENLLEDIGGPFRVAFAQHLLAHRDQRLDLGLERLRLALHRQLGEDLVERAGQLAFGPRRGKVGDRLALEEGVDGRDRLDAELGRDQFLLVDIDLDQLDAAVGILGRDLFEQGRRAACTARTTPPRNRG